jgi:LmbE family N-acetylglucosaminyl deacetylase
METNDNISKMVAVIVAHPDDETLWAGGTILNHCSWDWTIVSLCRKSDADRAPKFFKALQFLKAKGRIGDMDDSPEQIPLLENEVARGIIDLLPQANFNLIITHDPSGEYTHHRRHEETSRAVIRLWYEEKIKADELWTFAYEDGNRAYFPKPIETASIFTTLSPVTWQKKYQVIREIYGFQKDSWEAKTTPKAEAFWKFSGPAEAMGKAGK